MSAQEPEKPKLALVFLKEFYRVFLLGLSVFFAYFLVSQSQIFSLENTAKDWTLRIIYLAAALLAATIFIKSLNVFFWEGYRERKKLPKVPDLLRQGLNVIVYGATTLFVLQTVFQVSVSGLLTATGAMGVVIGLALKEMISDVFSGLILSLDRTIKMGDYVRIESRFAEPKIGAVAQMNWRTVHIHTPENVLVVVPNTFLTNNIITNLSEPGDKKEFELLFTFDFDVAPERIIRVLNSALYQTKEIVQEPGYEPKTRTSRVNGTGVEYKVKYWLVPSRCGPGKARNFVINNVLYCLNQAGLQLSYPKSDVFNAELPTRNLDIREDRIALLGKIELFSSLSPGGARHDGGEPHRAEGEEGRLHRTDGRGGKLHVHPRRGAAQRDHPAWRQQQRGQGRTDQAGQLLRRDVPPDRRAPLGLDQRLLREHPVRDPEGQHYHDLEGQSLRHRGVFPQDRRRQAQERDCPPEQEP